MPAGSKSIVRRSPAPLSPGIFAALVLGATVVGGGLIVYLFNPGTHHFYPVCLFHELTGLNCPGCGMTRALYALLHGNLRLALKDNALFLLALAGLGVWAGQFAVRKLRKQPAKFNVPSTLLWWLLVVMVLFGVIRNLPGFGWLCP